MVHFAVANPVSVPINNKIYLDVPEALVAT